MIPAMGRGDQSAFFESLTAPNWRLNDILFFLHIVKTQIHKYTVKILSVLVLWNFVAQWVDSVLLVRKSSSSWPALFWEPTIDAWQLTKVYH